MEALNIDERFRVDVEKAIAFLLENGAKEVYLFGSVAHGCAVTKSDIDIAIRGIAPSDFFSIYGRLMLLLEHKVDLVDLDLQPRLAATLLRYDELKRVA